MISYRINLVDLYLIYKNTSDLNLAVSQVQNWEFELRTKHF